MFKHYDDAEAWITGLTAFGIRPGLDRIQAMMERLDNPHLRLKVVHVAGTNGKGSTCAMITESLRACGYDVGTFTSPYLEKYTNRIKYNGEDIPEADVVACANMLYPIANELADSPLGSPTMFEITTAIAFIYFARIAFPDYVVLETGLGGRLDVTNIVNPVVSVITNIGMDHTDVLGDSLTDIAKEKAGIIKSGVPVISAASQPEVIDVLQQEAAAKKATLYLLGKQFGYTDLHMHEDGQAFDFYGPYGKLGPIELRLVGEHQARNAATALMTLEALRQFTIALLEEEDIRAGLLQTQWPGRFERMSDSPVLVLDGAHNPEGAEVLAETLQRVYPGRKFHFMLGMLRSKNHERYLEHILPIADTLIVSEPNFRGPMEAAELLHLAEAVKKQTKTRLIMEPDWKTALERLKQQLQPDDIGIVAGSLYLISDVRSWILHQTESDKGW